MLRNNTSIWLQSVVLVKEKIVVILESYIRKQPLPSDDYKCPCCDKTLEEINNHTVVVDRDTYKPVLRKYERDGL